MHFHFSSGQSNSQPVIDMCLEKRFQDGNVLQAISFYSNKYKQRVLAYREGTSGQWTNATGLSFEGIPKTPENIAKALGRGDPISEVYVMPAP